MTPDLVSIHPWTLLPHSSVGVDVLVWDDHMMTAVKCIDGEDEVSDEKFTFLTTQEGRQFYVTKRSSLRYRDYLSDRLKEHSSDQSVPPLIKLTLLCEAARFQIVDALETGSLEKWVRATYRIAGEFADQTTSAKRIGKEIASALRKDGGFATHAFNTGLYSFLLAKEMQLADKAQVEAMVAGFLHDTGKFGLDPDYPDQFSLPAGYLDVHSSQVHPHHCSEGFSYLSKVTGITKAPLLAVYQHHEHVDGSGTPVGITSRELPEISKICAVANRWDGLLCDRKGRSGTSRIAAWKTITYERNHLWNEETVKCLERILNRTSQNF